MPILPLADCPHRSGDEGGCRCWAPADRFGLHGDLPGSRLPVPHPDLPPHSFRGPAQPLCHLGHLPESRAGWAGFSARLAEQLGRWAPPEGRMSASSQEPVAGPASAGVVSLVLLRARPLPSFLLASPPPTERDLGFLRPRELCGHGLAARGGQMGGARLAEPWRSGEPWSRLWKTVRRMWVAQLPGAAGGRRV